MLCDINMSMFLASCKWDSVAGFSTLIFLLKRQYWAPCYCMLQRKLLWKNLFGKISGKFCVAFLHNIFLYNTIEALLCRVSYYLSKWKFNDLRTYLYLICVDCRNFAKWTFLFKYMSYDLFNRLGEIAICSWKNCKKYEKISESLFSSVGSHRVYSVQFQV